MIIATVEATEWRDQKNSSRPIPRLFFETKIFETEIFFLDQIFSKPIPRLFFETKWFRDQYRDFFFETKCFRDRYRDFFRDQMFSRLIPRLLEKLKSTRSSWLNCALRDDEPVYCVSIGHYEAGTVGNWWYWVSRGHLCLYILHKVDIWKGVTHAWQTDNFER